MSDNGFKKAPDRYSRMDRETVDRMRDLCHALRPGHGDDFFSVACATHALKYKDRAGAKGDIKGDREKAKWWGEMQLHALDLGPDPRYRRRDFVPYKKEPILLAKDRPWPLQEVLTSLVVAEEDLTREEWSEKSGWPVETLNALVGMTEAQLLLSLGMEDFGRALAALRHKKGMTTEQLAKAAGVATNTINRWENGKNKPTEDLLNFVLDVLRDKRRSQRENSSDLV